MEDYLDALCRAIDSCEKAGDAITCRALSADLCNMIKLNPDEAYIMYLMLVPFSELIHAALTPHIQFWGPILQAGPAYVLEALEGTCTPAFAMCMLNEEFRNARAVEVLIARAARTDEPELRTALSALAH